MGCCNPNQYKQVREQEEQINQSGKDTLPVWLKVSSVLIVCFVTIWMII